MYYENKLIRDVERVFYQDNRDRFLRLDLNENPGGLPEDFISETLSEVTPNLVSQYPEMLEFTQALAEFLGCETDNICVVNGSSEGVRFVIEAFTSPSGRIVGVTPSYAMYQVYAEMYGREFVGVPYEEDLSMPVENILTCITPETQLAILLNPNNPMGNVYSNEEVERVVQRCRECEVTLLIDEAYIYFYPNELLHYALEEEHIFVTRTFSKLFSLAGLRLGYVVGRPEGIKMLNKLCTPHNVNAVAMLFARKMLTTPGMIDELVQGQLAGKAFLVEELEKHGYEVNAKEGNFIFIKAKTDPDILVQRMQDEKKILIKTYDGVGELGKCLRVTTAEEEFMRVFLDALLELDR